MPLSKASFDNKDFIRGWYMPPEICDEILLTFNNNKDRAVPGRLGMGGQIDNSQKESLDISVWSQDFGFPFDIYRSMLQECLESYLEDFTWCNEQPQFNICENYNIQWYPPGGGFKVWHFENTMEEFSKHRSLVFMTYLNDVPDGGTEFLYQNLKIPAVKGLTLIWPPFWTHVHRGIVSHTSEKFIITGWYNYVDYYNKMINKQ